MLLELIVKFLNYKVFRTTVSHQSLILLFFVSLSPHLFIAVPFCPLLCFSISISLCVTLFLPICPLHPTQEPMFTALNHFFPASLYRLKFLDPGNIHRLLPLLRPLPCKEGLNLSSFPCLALSCLSFPFSLLYSNAPTIESCNP